jgi:hypothetical protein
MEDKNTSQAAGSGGISRSRRPRFLLLVLAALAGLALVAGACSDSGKSENSGDSGSAEDSSGSGDSSGTGSDGSGSGESGESSTEGSESGGADPVDTAAARQQLEEATTSCEVLESMETLFGTEDPSTVEEVRTFVDTFVTLVNKMAETAADPALAGQLETTAENLRKFAEDNGYEPAAMNFSGQPDYPGVEEDFAAVDQWYQSEIGNCVPEVGTAPTP